MYAVTQKSVARPAINSFMSEENTTGSNAVWAISLIIIVAIIAGLVYYSGILTNKPKNTSIDVDVTVPSAPAR